jgi:hypothetical protein
VHVPINANNRTQKNRPIKHCKNSDVNGGKFSKQYWWKKRREKLEPKQFFQLTQTVKMPKAQVYCGFAEILVHLNCSNVADLRKHNQTIGKDYEKLHVEETNWQKNRKKLLSQLQDK